MDQKRDRMVVLYQHRASASVLLFPYVFFMQGQATASGDAVEILAPAKPAVVGKEILRLLRAGKKVDLEAMKSSRLEQLKAYRRGQVASEKGPFGEVWGRLLSQYPALAKGPATFLRHFAVCEITERDGSSHRKLVQTLPSQHRGCATDGKQERIPITLRPGAFGQRVLEFLAE